LDSRNVTISSAGKAIGEIINSILLPEIERMKI